MAATATEPPFASVGIVGLGLIGGSVALALRAAWPSIRIAGVDTAPAGDAAVARKIVDERRASARALADLDLILLATPVSTIIDSISELGRSGVATVVTDVGSTKRRVLEAAESSHLRNFVGGHPMAGGERGGLDGARADLFRGKPWFLSPAATASEEARDRMSRLVQGIGASLSIVAPDVHDRTVAYLSHLPQLLSLGLMVNGVEALGEESLQHAGRGFDDMTRLAASSFGVWESILATNADYIVEALQAMTARMTAAIATDAPRLQDLFARANRWRERLDERRGTAR
ncbi:MAG TPA: prephenate dehydrogenase/arogenate dehydrogenase family protein [Vicinamibacterales bacterium]|nr:prephenate dehydrogenase/arogenate dehydrogenase family protein [Vicinamibacterales bacterium]